MRTPQEQAELVQGILAASENDESTWIEWKNGLVLREKATRVEIARHILGMANRLPEDAARHAGGCGYIVIGAEPGSCGGVTEIDNAELDAGLRPYLGSDGPRWSPQYVHVQDQSVLVVTVDPPRRGDRMFTLRREYGKYLPGMVFVRRAGRTIQAEPGDIRDLEDRYAATNDPITLYVRPSGDNDAVALLSVSSLARMLDNWETRERMDLLSETALAADADERSVEDYQKQVEGYISEFREYFPKYIATQVAERPNATPRFALVNTSDRNYIDVRVEVSFTRTVMVFDSEDLADLPDPPGRPRKRGARKTISPYTLSS